MQIHERVCRKNRDPPNRSEVQGKAKGAEKRTWKIKGYEGGRVAPRRRRRCRRFDAHWLATFSIEFADAARYPVPFWFDFLEFKTAAYRALSDPQSGNGKSSYGCTSWPLWSCRFSSPFASLSSCRVHVHSSSPFNLPLPRLPPTTRFSR